MATALTIITKAMQKSGILTANEVPTSEEANDALDSLNGMLASWSNDSLMCVSRVTESFVLSSGVGVYTIGDGQTFDTVRPIKIIEAHVTQGQLSYPSMYLMPDEVYQGIELKTIQSIPEALNYTNAYPYGTIRLYPYPAAGYTFYITSEKELVQFSALNEVVSLPPGWERALIYNLSIELSPEYGQKVDPLILKIAGDAKGKIAKAIMRARTLDCPPLTQIGQFNIWSGYYTQ